jgi:HK97 family phage major capsid protein
MNEAYQIVDRVGVRVLRDPYTAKPYIKFYTTKRVGGDVLNFEAVKIIKFGA